MQNLRLKKEIKLVLSVLFLLLFLCGGYFLLRSFSTEKKLSIPDESSDLKEEVLEVNTARLTFVGDFLFEQPYYDALENGDDEDLYFHFVKPYFEEDDLSIGNMEVVIGNDTMQTSGVGYNFCAPESIGYLVSTLDLEVLSTANNHAFDRGRDGVISTLDFFSNHTDIMTVGTFREASDREKLNILEINQIKFGFLAYTMSTNVKPTEDELYMVSYYKSPFTTVITDEDKEILKEEVANLREKVDVVIVMMHWGEEFTFTLTNAQKDLANYLNSLGVDIVIGNHSHNIQTMEWVGEEKKTLVYYSLGNFVSADYNITRTTKEFNNAYQVGLLSQVLVTKNDDGISLSDITTEPIINYYDKNLENFMLIPYSKYTEDYEYTHYLYQSNFNKDFIRNLYHNVIPAEFR